MQFTFDPTSLAEAKAAILVVEAIHGPQTSLDVITSSKVAEAKAEQAQDEESAKNLKAAKEKLAAAKAKQAADSAAAKLVAEAAAAKEAAATAAKEAAVAEAEAEAAAEEAQVKEPAAPAEAPTHSITVADIRGALKSYAAIEGRDAALGILTEFGAEGVSGLNEADFPAIMAKIK